MRQESNPAYMVGVVLLYLVVLAAAIVCAVAIRMF